MKIYIQTIIITALTATSVLFAFSQTATKSWIEVNDGHGGYEVMQFGEDSNATFGIDFPLNEDDCWHGAPPTPGSWYRWLKLPSRGISQDYACLDYIDMHPYPSTPEKRDSFILAFTPDSVYFDITLRWPEGTYLSARWDRLIMWFKNTGGGLLPDSLDMMLQDSIVIPKPHPNVNNIPFVYIFAYGPKAVDTDVRSELLTPMLFQLSQNYPNPFNPGTEIRYIVPEYSHVTFMVYDVLGREVQTLVDRNESPGEKSVRFDGSGLSNGVYFYKLSVGRYSQVRKMLLMK